MDHEQDPLYIRVGYPPNAPPSDHHKAVNRTALALLLTAILMLVAVLSVWAATQPDPDEANALAVRMSAPASPSSPSAAPTPSPSVSVRALTATERRFAAAVRKDSTVDGVTGDLELVRKGRLFCRLDQDASSPYTWPMNAKGIYEHKASLGAPERDAVRYLCPRFTTAWKQGMAAFDAGGHVVGAGLRPGTYRTYDKNVKNCSWKRTADGGQTLASATVPLASAGVTVTILATDGKFTSSGCGLWVPVL
jgi:hypothetical protein